MTYGRTLIGIGALLAEAAALRPMEAPAQADDGQMCAGLLTQQLRRFSDKCMSDLVGYVASHPQTGARISSEREKYHVTLIRDAKGFRAEAVSQFNFPMMKDETAAALKRLGWEPPENESDTVSG